MAATFSRPSAVARSATIVRTLRGGADRELSSAARTAAFPAGEKKVGRGRQRHGEGLADAARGPGYQGRVK
ncbi:hypothetical protein [Arboricoccus pini]|uniref:hypothetical protein n=1 Tax=Arboricoccus pini TaxID=1963835 RepID=UPI0013FD5B60|nr:hypothetical protein [Arboricoccus pini]